MSKFVKQLRSKPSVNMAAFRASLMEFVPSNGQQQHFLRQSIFTNAHQAVKKDCPYTALGVEWGATNQEIKQAYREKCRQYHPDILAQKPMSISERQRMLEIFQHIRKSYDALMNASEDFRHGSSEASKKYSFQVWRRGDTIAQNRTDVAGLARKRPAPPIDASDKTSYILGQPDGSGVRSSSRGEYLTDGTRQSASATVGTGRNKWTQPPEYKPFKLDPSKMSKHYNGR